MTRSKLTAAIATDDPSHIETWRACLQQTGLVSAVQEWPLSLEHVTKNGSAAPDVVLVDLPRDARPSFAFSGQLKQLFPAVRIIACSHSQEPTRELLLQAMRSGIQEIMPKPLDPLKLGEILTEFARVSRITPGQGQNLVIVMGAKGGVGTTTVAVNLSVQLTNVTSKRITLLDYSRPIGHAALMLDLQTRFSLRDAVENLDRLDDHFFGGLLARHKSKLEVLAGVNHPEEWLRMSPAALSRVANVAQSASDFVVLDYGSVYGAEWSSIVPLARMVLFVTEANVPSLWALQCHLQAMAPLGLKPDQIRIVVNRWHRADDEVLKNVEKDFHHPIFCRLPNDFRQVSEAINQGVPLFKNHSNPLVTTFQRIASQLAGVAPESQGKRRRPGLFS